MHSSFYRGRPFRTTKRSALALRIPGGQIVGGVEALEEPPDVPVLLRVLDQNRVVDVPALLLPELNTTFSQV
jgi:hypothetical protein